jgi:rubrerythrin
MRDDTWAKEDQARINLLKNVYQSREQDIELRKQLKENDKYMLDRERKEIQEKIEFEQKQQEEKERFEAIKRKNHQSDILMQIGERDRA